MNDATHAATLTRLARELQHMSAVCSRIARDYVAAGLTHGACRLQRNAAEVASLSRVVRAYAARGGADIYLNDALDRHTVAMHREAVALSYIWEIDAASRRASSPGAPRGGEE